MGDSIDYSALWFMGILILCSILWMARKPIKFLFIFLAQAIVGVLSIYAINILFSTLNIKLAVGINWITTAVTGILGFPGVALLYILRVMYPV